MSVVLISGFQVRDVANFRGQGSARHYIAAKTYHEIVAEVTFGKGNRTVSGLYMIA